MQPQAMVDIYMHGRISVARRTGESEVEYSPKAQGKSDGIAPEI